jgi:GNAT superfamily N-acetyltransferase
MNLRHATNADVADIVELLDPERNRVGFFPPGAVYDHVGRLGTTVAVAGGRLIGVISGYRSLRYARWCRPITFVVVRPECRRHGVGKALVQRISDEALDDGQTALQAWTREDLPGWQLWASMHFDPICVKHTPTADKKRTILFRRRLTAVPHPEYFKAPPVAGWKGARLTAVTPITNAPRSA